MLKFKLLIFFFLSSFTLAFSTECGRIPSALWCTNKTLDEKCGFTKLCERYEKESKGKKQLVTLVMETECIYCQRLIKDQLKAVYDNLGDYVDFEILPYIWMFEVC